MAHDQAIEQLRRNRKIFFLAIGLIVLFVTLVYVWSVLAPARGRLAAKIDLWHGKYVYLIYGLEPPERREIARLLQERYRIELRTVAGDIVSQDLVSNVRSYNEVMDATIKSRFGNDVYEECAQAAYKGREANPR
jgi:hypothetical protein